MASAERAPAGPRGATGALAEEAAARHLDRLGWVVLARNIRVGRNEIDIVAHEPGVRPTVVVVEVRSRAGPAFGGAIESVDARKVARLYRAASSLRRAGHPGLPRDRWRSSTWRVDVLAMRLLGGEWHVEEHLRGVEPP